MKISTPFNSFKNLIIALVLLFVGQVGWGQTITVNLTSAGGSTNLGNSNYNSGAERTWTQNGVTFGGKAITSGGTTIQGQATNAVIYNTTALPGRLLGITINQSGTARNYNLTGGTTRLVNNTAANYTASGTAVGTAATSWSSSSFTSTSYNFFAIKIAVGSASQITSIVITYEVTTCTAPTTQASSFTGSATGQTTATVGWQRGNGTAGVLVVARAAGAVNADPTSGTSYTANAAFGSGTQIGTGNYVVYSGTGTSATITGLTAGTIYHFAVYEYNTTDTCYNATELTGNLTTNSPPSLVISGSLAENTTLNNGQVTLTLTNDTFADATLAQGNFTLNNAPTGVSISGVQYNSPTSATITLAYNGTDFETNVTNFNITVANAELAVSTSPLTSGNLTITAVAEILTLGAISGAFGSQCVNILSTERTFTISSATVLKAGDISLAALAGFTYCETQNGTYTATLSFAHAGGTLAAKTIYVKFLPTTAITYNGNIVVSGAGAPNTNRSVTASGTGGTVALTTVAATFLTEIGAISGGTAVSTTCGTITAKGVVWGTAVNPTIVLTTKTTDGSGTADFVSTITGLSSNTTYNYRAYATNSNGVTDYGTNLTFTTPCAAVTPNYTNDFSTFPGSCWNANLSDGTPATGPTGTTAVWAVDGFLNSGTIGAAKINLYITNTIGWLKSVPFNLSAGGYRVKFNYGVTAYDATTPAATATTDDTVKFLVSTDGGTNWAVLQSWDSPNSNISNTSNDYVYNLTSYTNANTVFAFYASDGTVDNVPDYDFLIDNFVVETIPAPCTTPIAQPTALNFSTVTYNSIAGSFTASGATKYLVVSSVNATLSASPVNGVAYTAGQSFGGGTIVQASATTNFTLNSLTPQTAYHIFVFAYNDNCSGEPYYLTTTPLNGTSTTLEGPCAEETFANICVSGCSPATSNYGARTWTGSTGGTWTSTASRTDQPVNGNAITIKNGIITSPSTAGGIANISMTTTLPYADTAGNLTIKVNGNTVGTIAYSSATQTFSISNINIVGNVIITIEETNGARVSVDDIAWTCYNTVIWENGAWTNTTGPTASLEAVIKSAYTTQANGVFTAKKLTLTSGSFTINSGTNITVVGAVINSLTADKFVVENNANLLQKGTVNSNSGNITVKRNSAAIKRLDYTLWSSPVTGQGLYAFSKYTLPNRFYVYDSTNDVYSNAVGFNLVGLQYPSPLVLPNGVNGIDLAGVTFATGKGYLIRVPYDHPTTPFVYSGIFTGIPHSGDVSIPTTSGLYYATGNPYPSTIDASKFITDNAIGNTLTPGDGLYFWRKTNNAALSSYATYTTAGGVASGGDISVVPIVPNGVIQVGEGFIVKATSTSLRFNNDQRIANNDNQFLRTTNIERHRIWLNLSDGTSNVNQMMVAYMTGATQDIDAGIDGRFFNDNATSLNSLLNNEEFAVQGRSLPFDASDIVPLAFKAATAGNYSISIDHVDGLFAAGSQSIYLKDTLTNTEYNLNSGAYNFASDAGTFTNRFAVVYQSQLGVGTPNLTANSVVIYNQNTDFVVNSGNVIMASIKVFDIRGRLLQEKTGINSSQAIIGGGESNQVLLVQITSEDGITVTKKVMR